MLILTTFYADNEKIIAFKLRFCNIKCWKLPEIILDHSTASFNINCDKQIFFSKPKTCTYFGHNLESSLYLLIHRELQLSCKIDTQLTIDCRIVIKMSHIKIVKIERSLEFKNVTFKLKLL